MGCADGVICTARVQIAKFQSSSVCEILSCFCMFALQLFALLFAMSCLLSSSALLAHACAIFSVAWLLVHLLPAHLFACLLPVFAMQAARYSAFPACAAEVSVDQAGAAASAAAPLPAWCSGIDDASCEVLVVAEPIRPKPPRQPKLPVPDWKVYCKWQVKRHAVWPLTMQLREFKRK